MKKSKNVLYFVVSLVSYLALFALECALLNFVSPLVYSGRIPLWVYLPFLVLINPILVWFTAESWMKRLQKDLETK